MNNFQTILVAVFLAFFVFAVLIFSGLINIGKSSNNNSTPTGKVVIWGTFNNTPELAKVFEDMGNANNNLYISYIKKPADTYSQSLIEAFASGTGPDVFLMTPDMIEKFSNFVYTIPYTSYPQKTFTDSFIDGADVYLNKDGVIGFPIVVDPMVLYYNKDIFSSAGLAKPPEYWDELFALNSKLTNQSNDGAISQSMIALGQSDNVSHFKDILATLLLQNNNPIIQYSPTDGYLPVLDENTASLPTSPVVQILNFFTGFANPSNNNYSWNRSLPTSIDMFTGGKLAMYLGSASELFKIQSTNPNLSFDVTQIPQTRGTNTKRTYGNIYAAVVNKKSQNLTAALGVAGLLATGDNDKNFGIATSLPPASKSLLSTLPTDPYLFTFFNSAIISKTWADPDPVTSNSIFSELIQNILSNKLSVDDAVAKAQGQLKSIITN